MARRTNYGFNKWQKEQKKREKADKKRERRLAKKGPEDGTDDGTQNGEAAESTESTPDVATAEDSGSAEVEREPGSE